MFKAIYEFFTYTIPLTLREYIICIKYAVQRAIRGYDDEMVWEYHYAMANLNVKILTRLRDHHWGYPVGITDDEWIKSLNIMIDGFDAAKDNNSDIVFSGNHVDIEATNRNFDKRNAIFRKGMKEYVKYYFNLWD